MQQTKEKFIPLLILAVLALLAGLWAGLLRLGWRLPIGTAALPGAHGPLMVSGFLGTLISLERVVALRQRWMFFTPLLTGLGWIFGLILPASPLGMLLITLGSLGLVAIFGVIVRREPRIFTASMGLGALCWFAGNVFWLAGRPIYQVVFWWLAFLVLTIAGERLELSRVLRLKFRHLLLFSLAVALFLLGVLLTIWNLDAGTRLAGIGMLAMAAWLIRFDIARRNLRHAIPLTRYIAICLFAGYLWLGLAGIIALLSGAQSGGGLYDALLHTVFLGFAFSMIFGHAPIIVPSLTGQPVPFSPIFYLHFLLLHASLVLRVTGDLMGFALIRKWGGLLNEVAVLLFLAVTVTTIVRARRA